MKIIFLQYGFGYYALDIKLNIKLNMYNFFSDNGI